MIPTVPWLHCYGVDAMPKSFIINKKGSIRYISDQLSLANLMSILTKLKSYFREELPEAELMKYIQAAAPGVQKFNKIILDNNMPVYIGTSGSGEKILVREVFKDVLCDVCTNVHFVYAFDQTGKIKNIVLIEPIDLYGVPIDAENFLQDLISSCRHRASFSPSKKYRCPDRCHPIVQADYRRTERNARNSKFAQQVP